MMRARNGIPRYTTLQEIRITLRACRAGTDKEMLDYADHLEEFAREKFDDASVLGVPARPIVRNVPICHVHKIPKVYDPELDEFVCPDPFCHWKTYEDEEPNSQEAKMFHQIRRETGANAKHGSSEHRRHRQQPRPRRRDEGSMNARKINLEKGK